MFEFILPIISTLWCAWRIWGIILKSRRFVNWLAFTSDVKDATAEALMALLKEVRSIPTARDLAEGLTYIMLCGIVWAYSLPVALQLAALGGAYLATSLFIMAASRAIIILVRNKAYGMVGEKSDSSDGAMSGMPRMGPSL